MVNRPYMNQQTLTDKHILLTVWGFIVFLMPYAWNSAAFRTLTRDSYSLGCYIMSAGKYFLVFWRSLLPPSSELCKKNHIQEEWNCDDEWGWTDSIVVCIIMVFIWIYLQPSVMANGNTSSSCNTKKAIILLPYGSAVLSIHLLVLDYHLNK